MSNSQTSYEKEQLNERQSRLSGGVGILRVGGSSEIEMKEVRDRLEDAIQATRCALEKGIVIGGGMTLLYASKALDKIKLDNADQQQGIRLLQQACQAPAKKIIENAGFNSGYILEKINE